MLERREFHCEKDTASVKGVSFNMGDTKYSCICRSTKLPGRSVHNSEKIKDRQETSQEEAVTTDSSLSVMAWSAN